MAGQPGLAMDAGNAHHGPTPDGGMEACVDWLILVLGLAALLTGAELLVRGASRLALAAGLSPLVTGLTVVALGTSAPELFVSVGAGLEGRFALATGNVLGSNIFNVFAVLGISACIAPLAVDREVVRFDVPVMIAASLACWLALADGALAPWECALLLAGMALYTLTLLRRSTQGPGALPAMVLETAPPPPRGAKVLTLAGLTAAGGVALLGLGADAFVGAAAALAAGMGVSEALIGATVAAAGTSLPELATSALAAFRGERDLAVGNVVGSNLFNVLVVLPAAGLAAPAGTAVLPPQAAFDLPVMMAAALVCLPVFVTGATITRAEGLLFALYLAAYLAARIAMDLGQGWGLAVQGHALVTALAATGLIYALALGQGLGALHTLRAETRRALRKLVVLAAGTLVFLAGVVMLVTPGPGLAAMALGLVILASEFAWARALLERLKARWVMLRARIKGPKSGP